MWRYMRQATTRGGRSAFFKGTVKLSRYVCPATFQGANLLCRISCPLRPGLVGHVPVGPGFCQDLDGIHRRPNRPEVERQTHILCLKACLKLRKFRFGEGDFVPTYQEIVLVASFNGPVLCTALSIEDNVQRDPSHRIHQRAACAVRF